MNGSTLAMEPLALTSDFALTDESVHAFRRDGHVLLRNVASADELATYRPAIKDAVRILQPQLKKMEERDTYGKAFIQVGNIWEHSENAKRFTFARRFAKIAASLLGVRGVRLYHDQALFKEGGGGPTPWHQDQHYWPLSNNNSITMWMPLVDLSADMGSMTFASGSQHLGYLGDIPISDHSERYFNDLVKERQFPTPNMGALYAGDATFHYGYMVHGAPGNSTPRMREVMTIIFIDIDMKVVTPMNASQEADLRRWFPGLKPGDLAASPLNPVLYEA